MTNFVGDFKELLARAGLTKAELARQLELSSRAVSKWKESPPGYAVAYLRVLIELNRLKP